MFVGVAERQEREEDLGFLASRVPAEILGKDMRGAVDVAQDRAVVLAHAAGGAAGAAGVDDAGRLAPPDGGNARGNRKAGGGGIAAGERGPVMKGQPVGLDAAQRLDPDHVPHPARAEAGGKQRLGQLRIGDDDRARAGVFKDVEVVALGVGDVGRHGDQTRRHDGQIGDAPFGAVFRDEHHAVAGIKAEAAQGFGKQTDLSSRFAPAQRSPGPATLGPEERTIPEELGPVEEHGDEVRIGREIGKLHGAMIP